MRINAGACFALLGALCGGVLARAPELADYGAEYGADALAARVAWQMGVCTGMGLLLTAVLQWGRAATGGPARFLLLLAPSAAIASWLSCMVMQSIARGHMRWHVSLPHFLDTCFNMLFWGGLFGWLYVLYMRRRAGRLYFAALMARRALLTRQVAQAELAAARSHVDPAGVAQALRVIRAGYDTAPEQAAAMLDELVDGLRRAKKGKEGKWE